MGLDFDVLEFCRKLRSSKQPPYECPVSECRKVYKSLFGLQYHLVNYDHNNPTPTNPTPTPGGRKKGRGSHNARPPTSTQDLLATPTREGLTYAEAQKMVEFEVDGRITRVSIYEPLPIMSKEEYEATYGKCDEVAGSTALGECRPGMSEEKARLPEPCYSVLDSYNISDAPPRPNSYIRFIERSAEELDGEVEYDMDEEDSAWLSIINERRAAAGLSDVPVDTFELLMDRLEKESYFQMQSSGKTGEGAPPVVIDDDAVCCICMDGECQNSNVILFCDMCNLAVHQDCYGVPYIPEGQWLCRRCLQSPSRAVDCVLCPNNGGAFKQTDRGHWAHVVCALWIPEVRFANTVFLEPIDSIETIPPARWKLTCYICKQRGVGACIQCHKTNCYAAFHVTCAQQAGLFMKMDTVRDSTTAAIEPGPVMVQKTAYCDAHTPPEADSRPRPQPSKLASPQDAANEESRQKMKKARRLLAKKRSSVPVISIPTIPPERIQEIASLVNIPKKSQLIQRLIAYWTLKRQFRNGVPLLRRLQSSHLARRDDPRPLQEVGELYRQLKFWQCLRQDLERARLLCELVRKREKLKKEYCKIKELCLRMELCPREWLMLRLLEMIQSKDVGDIFSEPVDPSEVPNYLNIVSQPMDLSTMRTKVEDFQYQSLDALEADFSLMISNCMAFNSRDTIFYRAAIKMRDQGGALIRQARRDMEATGFDPETGLLLSDTPSNSADVASPPPAPAASSQEKTPIADDGLAGEIDRQLADVTSKLDTASRDALARLLELLDRSQGLKNGPARAKRFRVIKTEIAKLRRKMARWETPSSNSVAPTSEAEDGISTDSEREVSTDEENDKSKRVPKKITAKDKNARPSTRRSTSQQPAPEPPPPPTPVTSTPTPAPTPKEPEASDNPMDSSSASLIPTPTPGKRGRRKKPVKRPREDSMDSSSNSIVSPLAPATKIAATQPPTADIPTAKESLTPATPVTPVKMSTSEHQTQMTVSPSGVNRRTAVLFTRKAQAAAAFRKPDLPGSGPSFMPPSVARSAGTAPPTIRRRVGRPRKNPDPALIRNSEPSLMPVGGLDKSGTLSPAPAVPFTESFRVYRTGGEIPAETDEDTQSESSCSSCSSTDGSTASSGAASSSIDLQHQSAGETSGDEDGTAAGAATSSLQDPAQCPEPLDLVWAKCRGYPWYPALIIDPNMPRTGYLHNGVPIPAPPADVLALRSNYEEMVYLVLFFDTKRTWQWLPRNKLEPLGNPAVDEAKVTESRKPTDRKAVRKAYQEALSHRCQVSGGVKRGRPASLGPGEAMAADDN
ncbi:peregrin [Anabrus simplex]|uniref:peregrin n=1 Tax=Anabrus simplex TaxID=316456 RepID=UPI0035A3ABE9